MKCPYCGSEITKKRRQQDLLTSRRLHIFQFIYDTAGNGRSEEEIMAEFGFGAPETVRSTIHYINRCIEPIQIICKNKRYYVIGSSSSDQTPPGRA